MAAKFNKAKEFLEECDKVWGWLRKYPAYKSDVARKKTIGPEVFKSRWGFWPPAKPTGTQAPSELRHHLKKILQVPSFTSIELLNISSAALFLRGVRPISKIFSLPQKPPEKLRIQINLSHPNVLILRDILRAVRELRKVYGIKEKRVRTADLLDRYRIRVETRQGKRGESLATSIYPAIDVSDGIARVQRRKGASKANSK